MDEGGPCQGCGPIEGLDFAHGRQLHAPLPQHRRAGRADGRRLPGDQLRRARRRAGRHLQPGGPTARPARAPRGHPGAALVGRRRHLRRRRRHGRGQGDQRERCRPGRDRRHDQHLDQSQVPRALDRRRGPPRAGPAAVLPELRRHERLPRLRQRHGDRGGHDRFRVRRVRAHRQRRGLPTGPGAHDRPAQQPGHRVPRRAVRSSRPSPWARAPSPWCSAAPTPTRRGTAWSGRRAGRGPSTTSCASGTTT